MRRSLLPPLSFEIVAWTVVRFREDGACHVVGYRLPGGLGRASSPILFFDRAAMTAITSSGNRYALVGDPSEYGLADPVVVAWRAIHGLPRHVIEAVGVDGLEACPSPSAHAFDG